MPWLGNPRWPLTTKPCCNADAIREAIMRRSASTITFAVVLAVISSVTAAQPTAPPAPVYYPGATWEKKDPAEAGINAPRLKEAIDFAIERGFKLLEAGAQGEHKLARGFLPSITYSAHKIRDPAFGRAIGEYIRSEKQMLQGVMEEYALHDPYK